MAATSIEWHQKTAAKRIGVTLAEYQCRMQRGEKWCTKCKAWHLRQMFPTDQSRGDGLAASCRGRATRPSTVERTPEELRAQRNEIYRRYYAAKGGAAIRARVYARKRQLQPIPDWWREEQLTRGCAYCASPANTLDHFVAVARGGQSVPGNLVPACVSCNSSKGDDNPELWVDRLRGEFADELMTRPMGGTCALEEMGHS